MVELFEQNIRTNTRQSSKGNQLKWENESIWYKADYTGYEGLAEYVISHLLKYTNLNEDEYVLYEPEQIKYKRQIYNGVRSRAFIDGDWQIITLERLFKNVYNEISGNEKAYDALDAMMKDSNTGNQRGGTQALNTVTRNFDRDCQIAKVKNI